MKTIDLLKTLKETALNLDNINCYSDLDIYETINQNEIKYPVVCMALQYMTVKENFVSYTFQFYAAERLDNGENNRPFAVAQLFDTAENYVAKLKQQDGIIDVELERQYNNSDFQTMDCVVCVYGQLTIDVEKEFSNC